MNRRVLGGVEVDPQTVVEVLLHQEVHVVAHQLLLTHNNILLRPGSGSKQLSKETQLCFLYIYFFWFNKETKNIL